MSQKHKDRLLKLAAFLENVPKKLFDLDIIVEGNGKELKSFYQKGKECGAAGCAIGHLPCAFPRDFKYEVEKYENEDYWSGETEVNYETSVVDKNGNVDFDAAYEFFDLTRNEANFLFLPESYPEDRRGAKSVAKRLKAFVARRDEARAMLGHDTYNDGYNDVHARHPRWGLS